MLQVEIDQNLAKKDLQWLKLTFKPHRKSTITIYRATSIFDLHMRIVNLQGLGAPDKPKKKTKHAEIDFTSYHSFLRVRRDQFHQIVKKKTLPTVYTTL
jgi:hypothetical protein